jgi:hypothetical protein
MFKRCKRPPLARVARPLTLVFMAAAAALAGCSAPQPMSYLYGSRWLKAEMDTYDTFIVSVDGKGYIQDNRIWVDPGPHHIVFQTLPVHGFTRSPERALDVNIEPCMRYYFEAKRATARTQDFEPRVNYKEPIVGCGPASTG